MNVIRPDNIYSTSRRRTGQARGRGRVGKLSVKQQVINLIPKYQIKEQRRPLVNLVPTSTSTNVTPKSTTRRRDWRSGSSSCRPSSVQEKNTTESGTGKNTTSASHSDGQEAVILMAITSGRGDARGEVGLAVMDVQYPHMILSQISDCHSYINTLTKIHTFNPVEILMPDTICEDSNNLYSTIKNRFNDITITAIPRMHFNDIMGLERIRIHCAIEYSSVELVVHQKYYALAACAALMKYIEFIQHIQYLQKAMRIEYQVSQNVTMIDIESAESLELVTTNGGQYNYNLFGALDRCSTPMGRRLLRASILQPPCDIEIINRRQLCIQELISNCSLHSIIHPVVRRLTGANRLLSLAMHTSQVDNVLSAEKNLNYILLLKNIVEIVPELRATLSSAKSAFFQIVHNDLNDQRFEIIKKKILEIIHPDARSVMGYTSAIMQRCFAIKSGINDMLDIARQTYCELIDDMQSIVAQLGERYNFPLLLGCNMLLGYHIQMDIHRNHNIKIDNLPKEFIQVQKFKNSIVMTTEPLVVLSQHCKDACEELHVFSDVLLKRTLYEIREHIGCLFKLNDNIGELDLIMSLAQISSISDYTMPTFGSKLEILASKHPIMDILATECPIPNDVRASVSYNFQTITGPNMSGKTIYLKQIVLLHIMAQIGCYVPAIKAQFRIADRIFCRLGIRNDIEYNASTFSLEIKETQYILQSITSNSIVVLDELCRSTTVEEGSSIAWIICEKLAMTSAFTFNATHLLYLLKMADLYPNITNYYMEAMPNIINDQSDNARLIYTHQLKKGVSPIQHYGITLAKATNFPADILKTAKEIANQITEDLRPTEVNETEMSKHMMSIRKKNYDILAILNEELENDETNRDKIFELLKKLDISHCECTTAINTQAPISQFPKKNDTQTSTVDNTSKVANSLSTQSQKLTKRKRKTNSSISDPQIKKFISLSCAQDETVFKLPQIPMKNTKSPLQPRFYHQSPNGTAVISEEARNILKNPTTDPDSPLFVPRSNTFMNSPNWSNLNNKTSVVFSKSSSTTDTEIDDIDNDDTQLSPVILNNSNVFSIPPVDQSVQMSNENQIYMPFSSNIPQEYVYMRHILKNISHQLTSTVDSINSSSTEKKNEFFVSSDSVTRQLNTPNLLNDHRDVTVDDTISVNNQLQYTNSLSKDHNTNNTPTDNNSNLMLSEPSIRHISPILEPSYITLSSTELLESPANSQTSIDTETAQMLAREKEARIFRIIEGSQFDENKFFASSRNILNLYKSNYYNELTKNAE